MTLRPSSSINSHFLVLRFPARLFQTRSTFILLASAKVVLYNNLRIYQERREEIKRLKESIEKEFWNLDED